MKAQGIIFDVDGSLYPFDGGAAERFEESQLSKSIKQRVISFFERKFGLDRASAEKLYEQLNFQSNGELSVWLETQHGIPRIEYFAETWDLNPQDFMDKDDSLVAELGAIAARRSVLSNAPRIWIDRVLAHLGVGQLFDPSAIFSGEPDIRKPHPEAFRQIAAYWGLPPQAIISIGDQELSDILPAKSVGMRTVRIGRNVASQADFVAPDIPTALAVLKKEKIL